MAEIYKNIKTGVKAELIEINEKSKQVTLKKLADGKPTSTLMSSFEKYWKKIDGDATSEKKSAKTAPKKEAEKPVEEPAKADEVKKEEPKAEKPKKEKAEKPKKEKKPTVEGKSEKERLSIRDNFIKAISSKDVVTNIPTNYPLWVDVKIGEKNAFGIGFNARNIRVRAIKETLPKTAVYHEVKGGFSAGLTFGYDAISDIESLVKYVSDNFKDSDILKKKRKEKKVEKSEKKETKNSKKVETEEK